jgi:PAS domain S-box-containing protein
VDLSSFLGRNGYLPHGYCFTWSPGLLWSMVVADALVMLAYMSIPVAILAFFRRRPDARFSAVAILFGAFIFACGITHAMDIWTIWKPDYGLQALAKGVTAAVSVMTAVAVWRLIPAASRIPSVDELQRAVRRLEAEVALRRNAEEHAADVEQKLSLTLAAIDAGMITTDAAGNVVHMNAVAERITGWTHSEASGKPYLMVLEREGRVAPPGLFNVVDLMIEQGITVDTTHRVVVISRYGSRTSVEVNAALTRGDDGAIRGVMVVLKDLSAIDRAEVDMRRLAAIVESSSEAIIGKTLDGTITAWNRAAQQLFGYTEQEALGQSVSMLIPEDRRQEEMDILTDIFGGKIVPAFDTVRLGKGGRRLDLSVTISSIRDREGRIVGGSKIARDISAQKRMVSALRESEARLRFALEVAEIGDWDLDLQTGAARRSIRHDRIFGFSELQPEWSIETFLRRVHPDDREAVAQSYRRSLIQAQDWRTQCRIVWPDESIHWIDIRGSTRYEPGESQRMLGIVSDVTQQRRGEEIRRLSEKLESENRQIQESNRLKSQFLANMSHELRSPLNAIIGFSDLLYADGAPIAKEKQHQFIGHIRTSGRHLLQLINDVLDLSKVESGKFEFYPEPVDVAAVIEEVKNVLFTQIQRKRLEVELQTSALTVSVVTDPSRLKQALFNYLSNAIKFTAEGGLIVVRAMPEGHAFFRIDVEDSGVGIAESDLPRLFVEFQQLDSSYTKRHQGTGLGLALTRRLIQAQGGSVGVRSVLGKGSVFHLTLPMSPAASEEASQDHAPLAGNVLVIEDDPDDRALIVKALSGCGHRVDVAESLDQAVQQAAQNGYDALTLDLVMGRSHGLDALARIRNDARHPYPPRVLALTLDAHSAGTASFGIADVLSKPLRVAEVVLAMARFGLSRRHDVVVMVIDDDPVALNLMCAAIDEQGVESVGYLDGSSALDAIAAHAPSAIVLDLLMPGVDGFQVLDRLRGMPQWCDVPVFIWTSMNLTDSEYDLLVQSAQAIIGKGGAGLEPLLERLRRWRPMPQSTPA